MKPKKGSMSLDKLIEANEAGHSAFYTGKDGKRYFNFAMWENQEADQYGNIASFQLNSAKDANDTKVYFGNVKGEKNPF